MAHKFKFFLAAMMLSLGLAMTPVAAHAQNSDFGGIGGKLCQVVQAITGNVGRAIATIAVVFLGIGAFFGKVTWGLAVAVSIGIFAIFGAGKIVGEFAGGGAGCITGTGTTGS